MRTAPSPARNVAVSFSPKSVAPSRVAAIGFRFAYTATWVGDKCVRAKVQRKFTAPPNRPRRITSTIARACACASCDRGFSNAKGAACNETKGDKQDETSLTKPQDGKRQRWDLPHGNSYRHNRCPDQDSRNECIYIGVQFTSCHRYRLTAGTRLRPGLSARAAKECDR